MDEIFHYAGKEFGLVDTGSKIINAGYIKTNEFNIED